MTRESEPETRVLLILVGAGLAGLLAVVLTVTGLFALIGRSPSRQHEVDPASAGESTAASVVRDIGRCLREYRISHPRDGFPDSLGPLGPTGTGCLSQDVVAGDAAGYHFTYLAALPDRTGRIRACTVCARPLELGHTGWTTHVYEDAADGAGNDASPSLLSYRAQRQAREPVDCAAVWMERGGRSGPFSAVRHCTFSFAAAHREQGYPSEVAQIGPNGTGCLSVVRGSISSERDLLVWTDEGSDQRVAYLPALPDQGRQVTRYTLYTPGPYPSWGDEAGAFRVDYGLERELALARSLEERAEARRRAAGVVANIGRLERQCQDGSPERCLDLGEALVPRPAGPTGPRHFRAWESAVAAYVRACERGNGPGCLRAAEAMEAGRVSAGPRPEPAPGPGSWVCGLFARSCALRSAEGCWEATRRREDGRCPDDALPLVELLERACEGGVWRACVALGERLAAARGANRQSARAAAILTKACTAEPPTGCATLGRMLLDGISVTPDRALARHYLRRGCALEGDAASCRELDRPPGVRFFNAEDEPQQAR